MKKPKPGTLTHYIAAIKSMIEQAFYELDEGKAQKLAETLRAYLQQMEDGLS